MSCNKKIIIWFDLAYKFKVKSSLISTSSPGYSSWMVVLILNPEIEIVMNELKFYLVILFYLLTRYVLKTADTSNNVVRTNITVFLDDISTIGKYLYTLK